MGDEIRIKRDTEVFFSTFQELVAVHLETSRADVAAAGCDQLKEKIALVDAKVNAILALMVSHSRERSDAFRKIDAVLRSMEASPASYRKRAKGLSSLNRELKDLIADLPGGAAKDGA
ncbi:MAG: hypothetical protein PVH30_11905 [Desulfobacterales bacterium]|jgi:hypothetical protein